MNLLSIELLLGRILLGGLFLLAGIAKIVTPAPFTAHMAQFHIPTVLLPAVIGLEVVGGALVILGWRLSWTALALAGFCVMTALVFHFDFADKAERTLFFKDLAIAGGLLVLASRP
jgi:putative oxidoreductase